jgi:FimV-like protein
MPKNIPFYVVVIYNGNIDQGRNFMRKLFLLILVLLPIMGFAATYGPTTKADQLWQIAIMVRPSTQVSIEQTMAAIIEDNPKAFKHGQIKPGYVLKIPDLQGIQQIAPDMAQKTIVKQAHSVKHAVINKNVVSRQIGLLQTQYSNVGKALLNFDQQYQAEVTDLIQNNKDLQDQIAELQQQENLLLQQISNLQDKVNKLNQPSQFTMWVDPYIKYLQQYLGETGFYLSLVGVAVILLFFIWWVWPWRKRYAKIEGEEWDIESEYDFMGSQEGVPAKLDLARAYIDMDNKDEAQKILTEILKQGNAEQQSEAKDLLEKIQ